MDKRFKLRNADDVIDILGGTVEVARRLDVDPRVVSNWRTRGLPRDTQHALTTLLDQKGISAPPSLWRQREIAK
jgi:transposase-like protein